MKYFILSIILLLLFKNNICFSQEALGLNNGFDYNLNSINNDFDIVRTDQDGNVLWRLTISNNNNNFFDSTQSHYLVFGRTLEKNGKIISDPTDYDYWLVPKVNDIKFIIYPNPSSGIFSIFNHSQYNRVEIEIYDSSNRLIFKNQLNDIQTTINIMNYSKGIYFVKFFENDETLKFEKICIN